MKGRTRHRQMTAARGVLNRARRHGKLGSLQPVTEGMTVRDRRTDTVYFTLNGSKPDSMGRQHFIIDWYDHNQRRWHGQSFFAKLEDHIARWELDRKTRIIELGNSR